MITKKELIGSKESPPHHPWSTRLPFRSAMLVVISASLVSYSIGRALRSYLFWEKDSFPVIQEAHMRQDILSSCFGAEESLLSDNNGICRNPEENNWEITKDSKEDFDGTRNQYKKREVRSDQHGDDDDVEPVGTHLLMDVRGIDCRLLQSKDRLKEAVFDLVDKHGGFDLRYVYSHDMPQGIVLLGGVSSENHHIWLHAWPAKGVATLDVFGAGSSSDFLALVPEAERMFGVYLDTSQGLKQPNMTVHWAQKYRGFPGSLEESDLNALADLQWFPVGKMTDYKKEVSRAFDMKIFIFE
jgi:S-adenosylmethionine/arginine decarboxylase-like enzyme